MPSKELTSRVMEACPTTYDGYGTAQLEVEIRRLLKTRMDHAETKATYAKEYNELIGEAEVKIQYCVERIDYIQHENAVETHLNENS